VEFLPYLLNGRKAVDVSTGFNRITILDDQGYVWLNDKGLQTAVRWDTDTTGAAFNGNTSIYGYFFTFYPYARTVLSGTGVVTIINSTIPLP